MRNSSQKIACSTSLPTHASSILIGFPSLAMFIVSCQGSSKSFSFYCCTTCSLWSLMLIGRIFVFSKLNFAPNAIHQSFSMFSKLEYLSFNNRYIVVSSAYIFTTTLSFRLGILNPFTFGEFHIVHTRGSIAKSKSRQERGSL